MKKIYLSLLFACVTFVGAHAQGYKVAVLDFEGEKWSSLIDNPQYGGPLLYGEDGYGIYEEKDAYTWYDEGNTYLKSTINYNLGTWCFWNGGVAVSNYYNNIAGSSYQQQLSVNYNKDGNHGYNNSANFAVCHGYNDEFQGDIRPIITFGDGVARVIDHMYVNNTAYFLNDMKGGVDVLPAATTNTYIDLVAEGYDANGQSVGTAKIRLQDGLTSMTEWTKFDLSSLGAVASIKLGFDASSDQYESYGYVAAGYVAIDNIAVRIDADITGITSVTAESNMPAVRKVIKNGRLVIINGDRQFTVGGAQTK